MHSQNSLVLQRGKFVSSVNVIICLLNKRMIAGEHISINTKTFQNDTCTFETADDILTLLVHLGYLTYDFDTKTAWIPNKEVRQATFPSEKVLDKVLQLC